MASPSSITASSAGSPPPPASTISLSARSLAMKPSATPQMPATSPMSMTQKEWIIPPRPKPGRKPATDTPPTKRKAQNRAAQRAFRERRAARVGELKEKLKEVEEEDLQERGALRDHITRLETDIERFRGEIAAWQERHNVLRQESDQWRRDRDVLQAQVNIFRSLPQHRPTDAIPLPPRRPPLQPQTDTYANSLPEQQLPEPDQEQEQEQELLGCGSCTLGSRCSCFESALNIDSSTKRSPSPLQETTSKRPRTSDRSTPSTLETDFTTAFTSSSVRAPVLGVQSADSPVSPEDRCGFCNDGSACVCAELSSDTAGENQLAPLLLSTPPPSETDVSGTSSTTRFELLHPNVRHRAYNIETSSPSLKPCANGPGTCTQCRADPRSTLFCKSLAAVRGSSQPSTVGCCGEKSAEGGCCRSGAGNASTDQADQSPNEDIALSCSEAYTVLSRHPRYEVASDGLGSWIGRLQTTPPRADMGKHRERHPMEIEAASVMGVLKLFDRRFGKEG